MRIAVDATCLAWGWSGIPKYVDRIVREWADQADIDVTLLANSRRQPFVEIDRVHQVGVRRPGGGVWRNQFASAWIARERPDVYWAPEMVLPRRVLVPAVVTIHDLTPITMARTKALRGRLFFRALGSSARRAERLIAVSQWTKEELERVLSIPSERIAVVPNGVDAQFTPGDRDAARARVQGRWQIGAPFILAVGTLEPRKGLGVVFDAARRAASKGAPWQLVLAGAIGDHGVAIASAADGVPGCHRLGPVNDPELIDLYRAADVVVAPALAEGFGIVPLEAMACGTPAIIAGGSGALQEISGAAAVVVEDRSPSAWLSAIEQTRRRRSEFVPPGIELAGRYRWSDTAAATLEVLRAATDAARRR